jgi:uncharacterized protein
VTGVIRAGDEPLVYECRGHEQLGILHRPASPSGLGLIMIPAGHQYRIGPYRQHVLMARELGARGIASLRIDPPAIGDSAGEFLDFEMDLEVAAAVEALRRQCPELDRIVLWGICGSASVIAMHVPRDPLVTSLILVNPWLRSEHTLAKAYLRHYYARKIFDPSFWRKLFSGRVEVGESIKSFFGILRAAGSDRNDSAAAQIPLAERMADGLEGFAGHVLIVLSDDDLTAQEFMEGAKASARWRKILAKPNVDELHFRGADHVFSEPGVRAELVSAMTAWLQGRLAASP